MNKQYETGLFTNNVDFIEDMYQNYLERPLSVTKDWKDIFDKIQLTLEVKKQSSFSENTDINSHHVYIREQIIEITNVYRLFGHLSATLDPLKMKDSIQNPNLASHNLNADMLCTKINLNGNLTTAKEAIEHLDNIYCGNIGFEYMHIPNPEIRNWLQNKIEYQMTRPTQQERISALDLITKTEIFEQFLHSKFIGAKRFSSEGSESVIAAVDNIINDASTAGVEEVVIGMAHRGRIDMLANILQQPYEVIMAEFKGEKPECIKGSGDVKYHLGALRDITLKNGKKIRISLTSNPSHLEAVNAVTMGRARAKQEQSKNKHKILPILIHGDASFAGQGVVYETLQLNALQGYNIGGTMHIIIDNQIGFTTNPDCSRSSHHASDIAKAMEIPILHVNGDDLDSVLLVSKMAEEFRQKFNKDIVLHIVCYRKYGHNEGDEPSFTQPSMCKKISSHSSLIEQYQEKLIEEKLTSLEERREFKSEFLELLGTKFEQSRNYMSQATDWLAEKNEKKSQNSKKINIETLREIGTCLTTIPSDFNISDKLNRILQNKKKSLEVGQNINWATAEALALGSLLQAGIKIRLAGQDSCRGTFSHRHAVMIDQENLQQYVPLSTIAPIEIINSPLSEYATMAFEYGYSTVKKQDLTLWEGQFGDFVNGAQIVIDQFISAAESKWNSANNLTLLLPHGYEGQGPEHSSARIERFLQLCAENNMQVVYCSTPANYFHVLRRQIYQKSPKPLIIFTPKSLLRHKLAVSDIEEMATDTTFKTIIANDKKAKKLIICSGKIYYDLLQARQENKIKNVAIVRLEQYYPFPAKDLEKEIKKCAAAEIIWCQEEPANMGAWNFVQPLIQAIIPIKLSYVGRPASASPASGYVKTHQQEQKQIINIALQS